MSFTSIELIRQHLCESDIPRDTYRDVPAQLTSAAPLALVHSNLKSGTVRVKGKELGSPQYREVFVSAQPASIGSTDLIPDSVVVASDSSLGKIYSENVDYHVDYENGDLLRGASSSIPSGAKVAAWYFAYRVYTEGIDYTVNYEKGTLKRVLSGAIENGQNVFVDYQTQGNFFGEDQITNSITEADDLVMRLIDPIYQDSSDQTLVTAETYLAVAILCRTKASAALQSSSVVGAAEISKAWRDLADRYENDGLKLAANFAAGKGMFNSPRSVRGGGRK